MTEQLESFQLEDELWPSTLPLVQPNFIFGVELEMENIKTEAKPNKFNNYWTPTTDNSLRNNGVEFVSLPLKAFQIEKAPTHLNNNFSTLVYTSVEKLLFKWVGAFSIWNAFSGRETNSTPLFRRLLSVVGVQ